MKVYDALADAFVAEGTTAVFGMMGDANIYWLDRLEKAGVRVFEVRHEGAGLAMADGWARITGRPGVCTTTGGPGIAQLATTMLVASRARTPLVAFCGDTPWGDDEEVQRLDQARFAAGVEAGFVRITSPDNAYERVREAFYLARRDSTPVILSMPTEIQHGEVDESEAYAPSLSLLNAEPLPSSPAQIERVADVLAASERPVIIVGRGAIRSGAGEAIQSLAGRVGAIIATSLMGKNWLNSDEFHVGISGLYATRTAMELFSEADCVVAVGAGLNKYTIEHGYLYPDATYVHIDTKPSVVMGNGRTAEHYLRADGRLAVTALDEALQRRGVQHTGYRTPDTRARIERALDDPQEYEIEPGRVDPRAACRVLDDALPGHIGLVLGGGHQVCFGTMLSNRARDLVLPNMHFGSIGQGLTTAMGAVVASGGRPAFLMEGDAGFMMHAIEFETAVRYALPLMVVVFNDQALGAEYHRYIDKGIDLEACRIPTPDLGAVGVALGGRGALVRSLDELAAAAEAFAADPGPMLVDLRISRNVVAVPYRRLFYGQEA
jgi:thiamine pyrophosphate-dependent acetolactate synthase large subunit-like protein